jgi:hypothetical protein
MWPQIISKPPAEIILIVHVSYEFTTLKRCNIEDYPKQLTTIRCNTNSIQSKPFRFNVRTNSALLKIMISIESKVNSKHFKINILYTKSNWKQKHEFRYSEVLQHPRDHLKAPRVHVPCRNMTISCWKQNGRHLHFVKHALRRSGTRPLSESTKNLQQQKAAQTLERKLRKCHIRECFTTPGTEVRPQRILTYVYPLFDKTEITWSEWSPLVCVAAFARLQ